MNSYELSRKFVDFGFENPSKIKPNHYALYFFSIEHCNRLGWKKEFGLPTTMAMEAIGIKSYNTYINTFKDLEKYGFIEIIEKSKNQYSSNIIALSNFNKALDKALDKAFIKHEAKQSESTKQSIGESISSIDKQLTNIPIYQLNQLNKEQLDQFLSVTKIGIEFFNIKTINTKPEKLVKTFSKEILSCYENCLKFFDENLRPKNESQKNSWLDVIDKLNRLDKIPFDLIEKITKATREDSFWCKNFLSLPKLRKNNPEGIKYIVVFNEKFIKNGRQQQSTEEIFNKAMQSQAARDFKY